MKYNTRLGWIKVQKLNGNTTDLVKALPLLKDFNE